MPTLENAELQLTESLKVHRNAAYYLAACLEEAIANDNDTFFFDAVNRVSLATGKKQMECIRLLQSQIAPADFPEVHENISILLANLGR